MVQEVTATDTEAAVMASTKAIITKATAKNLTTAAAMVTPTTQEVWEYMVTTIMGNQP